MTAGKRPGDGTALLGIGLAVAMILAVVTASRSGFGSGSGSEDGRAERPEGPWVEVTLCSLRGPVRFELPGYVQFDGPRSLRNIDAPAIGTFAVTYDATGARRYDAIVIDDVGAEGDGPAAVATSVVKRLDANPAYVALGTVEEVGDDGELVELPYEEQFNDRQLFAHAFAYDDVIVIVDVGVRDGSPPAMTELARAELEHLRSAVQLPEGDETACDGPSVRPVP